MPSEKPQNGATLVVQINPLLALKGFKFISSKAQVSLIIYATKHAHKVLHSWCNMSKASLKQWQQTWQDPPQIDHLLAT